jgi:hypothetical protein
MGRRRRILDPGKPLRRPLCDNLGLSWAGQRERIRRSDILDSAILSGRLTRPPGRGRGTREILCLPLNLVPGWLFGVQTGRVKEEIRPKLIRYRRECFRVLWDAFKGDILLGETQRLRTTLTRSLIP